MGGSVGLKGTDHVAEEALRRGAVPGSEKRAEAALSELLPFREELVIASYPGAMGGRLAEKWDFIPSFSAVRNVRKRMQPTRSVWRKAW